MEKELETNNYALIFASLGDSGESFRVSLKANGDSHEFNELACREACRWFVELSNTLPTEDNLDQWEDRVWSASTCGAELYAIPSSSGGSAIISIRCPRHWSRGSWHFNELACLEAAEFFNKLADILTTKRKENTYA